MKRILALFLVIIMVLTCFASCKKYDEEPQVPPTDEELIAERIDTFLTAYNSGDMEGVLGCLDAKTRNAFQAMMNLLGGIAGAGAGFNIDLSDLFSLGVSMTSDDFMKLEITEINVIDSSSTIATTVMNLMGSGTQTIYFEMVYENDGWYIHDMTDCAPSGTTNAQGSGNTSDSNNGSADDAPTDLNGSAMKTEIDPFAGFEIMTYGISPYCEIAMNVSNCSTIVQEHVTYSLDKNTYSNGDTAVVTAILNPSASNQFILTSNQKTFEITGNSEFVTTLSSDEIAFIETELADYVAGRAAQDTAGQFIFGYNAKYLSYIDSVTSQNLFYLSTLKRIKYDQYENSDFFNAYTHLYSVKYTTRTDLTNTIYVAVSAKNIVRTSDGTIKWGTNRIGAYDFTCTSNGTSLEDCISINVMGNRYNYDITQLTN